MVFMGMCDDDVFEVCVVFFDEGDIGQDEIGVWQIGIGEGYVVIDYDLLLFC